MLFNPVSADYGSLDPRSQEIMQKTIEFFETKGKAQLKDDDHQRRWYRDFLDFLNDHRVFSTMLTPPEHAIGDPDARWDTNRNCALNEILGFYGLPIGTRGRYPSSASVRCGWPTGKRSKNAPHGTCATAEFSVLAFQKRPTAPTSTRAR
jgi:hypothetical protein